MRRVAAGGLSVQQGPTQAVGSRPPRPRRQWLLVSLELVTGAAALIGGFLLVIRPDGSLLELDPVLLEGSPFTDWGLPGLLLAALVGGGFVAAGTWQWRNSRNARELSMLARFGLIVFEGAELAWIGVHPLQAVFGVVGVTVVAPAVAARS